jgi:hypothetical protein
MTIPIRRRDFDVQGFIAYVAQQGGEVGTPTNPYEVVRYRAYWRGTNKAATHVVYAKENGLLTWMHGSKGHYRAFLEGEPMTELPEAPSKAKRRTSGSGKKSRSKANARQKLLARDGGDCWYCGKPMGDDCTIEHLVPKADGGRNSLANYALAHRACNQRAADKPLVEKLALRALLRSIDA